MEISNLWTWIRSSVCAHCEIDATKNIVWASDNIHFGIIHAFNQNLVKSCESFSENTNEIYANLENQSGIPVVLFRPQNSSVVEVENSDDLPDFTFFCYMFSIFHDSSSTCPEKSSSTVSLSEPEFRVPRLEQILYCQKCHKQVYIFERFIVNNQIWHRGCFTCSKCDKLLFIGLYKVVAKMECLSQENKIPSIDNLEFFEFECLEHEKDEFLIKLQLMEKEESMKDDVQVQKEVLDAIKIDIFKPVDNNCDSGAQNSVEKAIKDPENKLKVSKVENDRLNEEIIEMSSISQELYVKFEVQKVETDQLDQVIVEKSIISQEASDNADLDDKKYLPEKENDKEECKEHPDEFASANLTILPGEVELQVDPVDVSTVGIDAEPVAPKPPPRIKKQLKSAMKSNNENIDDLESRFSDIAINSSAKMASSIISEYPESLNPFGDVSENLEDDIESTTSSVSSWNICDDVTTTEIRGASSKMTVRTDCSSIVSKRDISSPSQLTIDSASGSLRKPAPRLSLQKNTTAPLKSEAELLERCSSASSLNKKRPAPPPPPTASPPCLEKLVLRKKRPAPPPPLPVRRLIQHDSSINVQEAEATLKMISEEFFGLEKRAFELEQKISELKNSPDQSIMKLLLNSWFQLAQEKMKLLHRQSECVFLLREKQLDDLHTEIEYQLRCVIEKPERLKKETDDKKEAYLLKKLLSVIEEKSRLSESSIGDSVMQQRKIILDDAQTPEAAKNDANSTKQTKTKKLLKLRLKNVKKKLSISTKKK